MNDALYQISADNILKRFPLALRQDPAMEAFARIAAKELEIRIPETDLPRIYNRIDELPEEILDVLATDLKVDWYNFNYGLEAKRALIKSSPYVHRFLGTPESVNRMLSSVFPGSYVEEWFDYGGEPHHFQVVIETRDAKEPADEEEIMRAVRMVKRLSSHLDGIVFQCGISVIIETEPRGYQVTAGWTGRNRCGTFPHRAVKGGILDDAVTIETSGSAHGHTADLAGTKPQRATHGGIYAGAVDIETSAEPYQVKAGATGRYRAGTVPHRSTTGGTEDSSITVETNTFSQGYGSAPAGTRPYRTTASGISDADIQVETGTDPFEVSAPISGRRETFAPHPVSAGLHAVDIDVETEVQSFEVSAKAAGTETDPIRPKPGTGYALPGGLMAIVEGKGYTYRTIWCGRAYCRSGTRVLGR